MVDGSDGIESGADAGFEIPPLLLRDLVRAPQLDVVGPDLVSRDLLPDEAVERLVVIEGLDHVVAKAPRVGVVDVGLEASAVGVAHNVEPVSAPSLAVALGLEQAVDHVPEGIGRVVLQKGRDLGGRGRQPVQIVGGSTDPGPAVRLDRRFQAFPGQRPGEKPVDRRVGPSASVRRDFRPSDRPERPPGFARRQEFLRRPLGARIDPILQHADVAGRQGRGLQGHRQFPLMAHRPAQHARRCVAGNQGGTSLSALQKAFACPQVEIRHPGLAVAGNAVALENLDGSLRNAGAGDGREGDKDCEKHGHQRRKTAALSISGCRRPPGTGIRRCGRDAAVQADCMDRIALQRRERRTQPFPGINCGTRARSLLASGASNWH